MLQTRTAFHFSTHFILALTTTWSLDAGEGASSRARSPAFAWSMLDFHLVRRTFSNVNRLATRWLCMSEMVSKPHSRAEAGLQCWTKTVIGSLTRLSNWRDQDMEPATRGASLNSGGLSCTNVFSRRVSVITGFHRAANNKYCKQNPVPDLP